MQAQREECDRAKAITMEHGASIADALESLGAHAIADHLNWRDAMELFRKALAIRESAIEACDELAVIIASRQAQSVSGRSAGLRARRKGEK